MNGYIAHRFGLSYTMQVVPVYGGIFISGEQIYSLVRRHEDGAMFNFKVFDTNPTSLSVWAAPGSLPADLTELQGILTEFKIGTTSFAYVRDWTFPGNVDTENAEPKIFTIWYYSPGTLGHIGVETVAFIPRSMTFNTYYAAPLDRAQIISQSG